MSIDEYFTWLEGFKKYLWTRRMKASEKWEQSYWKRRIEEFKKELLILRRMYVR